MACYLLKLDSKMKSYRLSDLIMAKNPGERNSFTFISLQADFDNTSVILGGDCLIDTDRYGWWLSKNSSPRIYASQVFDRSTLDIFVMCPDEDNQILLVEVA
jgi:hypothetical protein